MGSLQSFQVEPSRNLAPCFKTRAICRRRSLKWGFSISPVKLVCEGRHVLDGHFDGSWAVCCSCSPTHELKLSFTSWRPCLSNPSVCLSDSKGSHGCSHSDHVKKWKESKVYCFWLILRVHFSKGFCSKTREVSERVSCLCDVGGHFLMTATCCR